MWWWIMYIFLLPPAGPEEAPEEAWLLDEERGAVHRGARLDHPRARPADSCSIHILGTLGRIYSRQWFDLQALRVRCMQIYRADHSSVGIVLSGELSMIANIIKMFGSVMKYFIDWLCVHLIEGTRAAGMPLSMSYFLVLAGCAVCTCPAPAPPPAWAAGGSSSGPKMQSQVVTRMSSSPVLSSHPRNVELLDTLAMSYHISYIVQFQGSQASLLNVKMHSYSPSKIEQFTLF